MGFGLAQACGCTRLTRDTSRLPALLTAAVLVARAACRPHVLRAVVEPVADVVTVRGRPDAEAGCTDLALPAIPAHHERPSSEVLLA
jgi:hypothetical protein